MPRRGILDDAGGNDYRCHFVRRRGTGVRCNFRLTGAKGHSIRMILQVLRFATHVPKGKKKRTGVDLGSAVVVAGLFFLLQMVLSHGGPARMHCGVFLVDCSRTTSGPKSRGTNLPRRRTHSVRAGRVLCLWLGALWTNRQTRLFDPWTAGQMSRSLPPQEDAPLSEISSSGRETV